MIPYFQFLEIPLGPISIQVWGLLVALGFVVGGFAAKWMLKRSGLNEKVIWDLLVWIMIGAFVCARLFFVLFYEPMYFLENPIEVFAIWQGGASVIGGFIGAILAGFWFLKRRGLNVMQYANAVMFGLPLGLFVGRIGCFLIHDHPGVETDFFLGLQFPDGIVRHDHGLYLSLNGLALFLVFLFLAKKKVQTYVYTIIFLIWYGVVRFSLDFLRATDGDIVDSRYLSLTPAQYISLVMIVLGIWLWSKNRK